MFSATALRTNGRASDWPEAVGRCFFFFWMQGEHYWDWDRGLEGLVWDSVGGSSCSVFELQSPHGINIVLHNNKPTKQLHAFWWKSVEEAVMGRWCLLHWSVCVSDLSVCRSDSLKVMILISVHTHVCVLAWLPPSLFDHVDASDSVSCGND